MRQFCTFGMIALALISVIAAPVSACSCIRPPDAPVALAGSTAVFVGKVTAIARGKDGLQVTVEVDRAWKGITAKTVNVSTAENGAACGFGFEMGKSYLIYASGEGKQPKLSTNLCTRTCHIDQAGDDLKAIGEGKKIADAK